MRCSRPVVTTTPARPTGWTACETSSRRRRNCSASSCAPPGPAASSRSAPPTATRRCGSPTPPRRSAARSRRWTSTHAAPSRRARQPRTRRPGEARQLPHDRRRPGAGRVPRGRVGLRVPRRGAARVSRLLAQPAPHARARGDAGDRQRHLPRVRAPSFSRLLGNDKRLTTAGAHRRRADHRRPRWLKRPKADPRSATI